MTSLLLAVEEHGGDLDLVGQLRGYGVVVFAVGLFCGSIYLLLATNIGSKMGFLVSFAALTGFIALLGSIWSTAQFPLTSLHGPPPAWKVREIVSDPGQAQIEAVRQIENEGTTPEVAEVGEIRASIDTALTEEEGEFKTFNRTSDYLAPETYRIGGGKSGLFGNKPLYAMVEVRPVLAVEPLPGQAPPKPRIDTDAEPSYVVLIRDLGALRLPQYVTVAAFSLLFAVSLVLLHKTERAEQAAAASGDLEPAPA